MVTVVAGTTNNSLFEFGDIDGEPGVNRLQHALGVEGGPAGELYIADTYNSRIKRIRAGENAGRTLAYRHVVRDIKHLGDWRGENRRIAWPPRTGYGIALLVQHRGDGTILASIAHMQ